MSRWKSAREWHWISYHAVISRGIPWVSAREKPAWTIQAGYVLLSPSSLSGEDRKLVDKHGIWRWRDKGKNRAGVLEHRLVALKKYGALPEGVVVRHLNGDRSDNRPENLVIGTQKENVRDHKTAYLMMMYWRERALKSEGRNVLDELVTNGSARDYTMGMLGLRA